MALIVPHQSQQAIQTGNAGQAAQYRSASAFMTPGQENLGRGIQQLAAGVEKLGGVIFDAEIRKRQEQMELALLEDMQAFQSESQAWADNYQQQNQGKNAVNAESDAQAFYKEKVDALRQRWKGIDRAQLYIQRNAGNIAVSGVNAMRDYGNKQQEAWKDSVFAGQMATFKDVASDWRSTPEEIQTAYQDFAAKNTAYLMSKGMDATAAQIQTDRVYREAMSARTEQGFVERLNDGDIAGARAYLEVMKHGDAAGFAAQYESGVQGSRAIGYDKNGGTSYGKFQISSKAGTFDDWLQWLDKNGYEAVAQELRAAGPADTGGRNGKAPDVWRALVGTGAITDEMQAQFINESIVEPALNNLPESMQDAVQSDPGLMQALFSTAVQHGAGGAVKLFARNWKKADGDREAFLDALYADRKTQFGSSTDDVQQSVAMRFDRERASIGAATVSPDKIRAYQNMLDTAAKEKQKTDREAVVLGAYSTLNEQISNLSPDQQDAVFYSGISRIEDSEVRNKLRTMREKDRELIDKKQTSLDATLVEDFEKQMGAQNVPYSVQLEAAASLKKNGMSNKAYDNLVTRINKGLNTVTKENETAADALYGLIDTAILGGQQFGAEDISRYAVAHNLTPKQKEDARKYFDEGGKEGFLWKSRTKIGEMYKYYTGKELKDNPQFFESVRKGLEGKTATEKALRETVASIVIGGAEGEAVSDKWSLGYGQDMTWNEAKKAGDAIAASWLPDVSSDDAKRIRDEARYMYGVKKSLTEQDVRWIRRRELGIPTPANRLPKEYANAGK